LVREAVHFYHTITYTRQTKVEPGSCCIAKLELKWKTADTNGVATAIPESLSQGHVPFFNIKKASKVATYFDG
jgi:hypothetical protein